MPYKDKAQQRAAQAAWFRKKYAKDRKFRRAEAKRKAAWLKTEAGRLSNAADSAVWRERQRRKEA